MSMIRTNIKKYNIEENIGLAKINKLLTPSFNWEYGLLQILSCMAFKLTLDLQYDDSISENGVNDMSFTY